MNDVPHLPARRLGKELSERALCASCRSIRCTRHSVMAARLAYELLLDLKVTGDALTHSVGVGARIGHLLMGTQTHPVDLALTTVAGVLHDVGSLPAIAARPEATAHAGIDGARWLASHGFPAQVCSLVAHRGPALHEARARGLISDLDTFTPIAEPLHAVLWRADLTTDPHGNPTTVADRSAEIRRVHGPDSLAVAVLDAAEPDRVAAFALAAAPLR